VSWCDSTRPEGVCEPPVAVNAERAVDVERAVPEWLTAAVDPHQF
jgi:hypothetical protein